jgi:hypothetical protein
MDSAWLIWSLLFSLVGMAVFVYGRRQKMVAPTLIGAALMVYTYFVDSSVAVVVIGVLLLGALVAGVRMENGY